MTSNLDFQQLYEYEKHQNQLMMGHLGYSKQWLDYQKNSNNIIINHWLAAKLKYDWPTEQVTQWPTAMQQQWHGWRAYYSGQYLLAHQHFIQGWQSLDESNVGFEKSIALGLAKVYTRTGYWYHAKQWNLYFLKLAKKHHDLFDISQGYGALGELFLRANFKQQAMSCFNIAFHLLPSGSGQQSKQLNFLASALGRNHEWLRAEALLKTSLQHAKDRLDNPKSQKEESDSINHSLSRLAFLHLARFQSEQHTIEDYSFKGPKLMSTPVAQGFLAMANAFKAMFVSNNHQAALINAQQAQQHFKHLLFEEAWATKLVCALTGRAWQSDHLQQLILNIIPIQPPSFEIVSDKIWGDTHINDNNGFASLLNKQVDIDAVYDCWTLFFI